MSIYRLCATIFFRYVNLFLVMGCLQTVNAAVSGPLENPTSYKAYYKLSLGPVGADSIVSDIEGTMTVEFQDTCDGWIVQQNAEVFVSTQEGTEQEIKWHYVTWESKDGSLFRFNMRRYLDDALEDDIRGVARIDPKASEGKAIYEKPYYFTQKFSPKALFPTAHFLSLLKAAKKGEKLLSCIVFDGSTLEGASEVNAFIGLSHVPHLQGSSLKAEELKKFWPIRFAIYGPHNTGEGPELESAQQIMENGVPLEYTIDYGEFKIKGVLERYDLLKEGC